MAEYISFLNIGRNLMLSTSYTPTKVIFSSSTHHKFPKLILFSSLPSTNSPSHAPIPKGSNKKSFHSETLPLPMSWLQYPWRTVLSVHFSNIYKSLNVGSCMRSQNLRFHMKILNWIKSVKNTKSAIQIWNIQTEKKRNSIYKFRKTAHYLIDLQCLA